METIDQKNTPEAPQDPDQEKYVPRPRWQVAMAWIGLAIIVIGIILYYYYMVIKY